MRRRRWLVGGAVVAGAGVIAVAALIATRPGAAGQADGATVSTVKRGTVTVDLAAAGTTRAVSTRGLSFAIRGTVTELGVLAGDTVRKGQVLARIDNADATGKVTAAQSQVETAEEAVTRASTTTTTTTACLAPVAFYVTESPATASPTPAPSLSPTPSPRPSRTVAPTATPRPSRTVAPTTGTCGSGGGSDRASGGGGSLSTSDSLYSAQEQLHNAELALAQAKRELAGTVITAPLAGTVLSVSGTLGANQNPGSTAFIVLGGVRDTEVRAQFSEHDVAALAVGQVATITLPNRPGQTYTGKVSQIDPAGTASGQLVRYGVTVAFDEVPDGLLYGQSANVTVTTATADDVLYVSSSAVTGVHDGTASVTVAGGAIREVRIGLRGDRYTEILSGLVEGEQIVVGTR